jgi:4-hydroxy 2-oxovalerate aldolase
MGRGAGNLKIELILSYLKSKNNLNIDLNTLSKLVESFIPLLNIYKWGTNLAYIVSGNYSLPQKDVMKALEIDQYKLSSIIKLIIKKIPI